MSHLPLASCPVVPVFVIWPNASYRKVRNGILTHGSWCDRDVIAGRIYIHGRAFSSNVHKSQALSTSQYITLYISLRHTMYLTTSFLYVSAASVVSQYVTLRVHRTSWRISEIISRFGRVNKRLYKIEDYNLYWKLKLRTMRGVKSLQTWWGNK